MLNGVKTDPGTGAPATTRHRLRPGRSQWRLEHRALTRSYFGFGTDDNNAHVQPDGVPTLPRHGRRADHQAGRGSAGMTLIGWAAGGFPVYARYGYTVANDATSPPQGDDRQLPAGDHGQRHQASKHDLCAGDLPAWDWQYVAGSGDLDRCNGRSGVAPEFPGGIYHYYATDTYPFLQRCVKGAVTTGQHAARAAADDMSCARRAPDALVDTPAGTQRGLSIKPTSAGLVARRPHARRPHQSRRSIAKYTRLHLLAFRYHAA